MICRVCAAAAILTLLCAGCATGERETDSTDVANRFLASIDAGDAETACELIAPETRKELEFSEDQPCAESLGSLQLPGGTVDDVEVWGDRAQAHGASDTLFLVELGAGWRVAAAGCTSSGDKEPYECLLAGS